MYNIHKLLKFRKQKDWHWKHDDKSPLTEKQKKTFRGLNYFPPNPKLHFVLPLNIDIEGVGSKIIIKTTDGDEQIYLKAGTVEFEVGGKRVVATVFEDPEQEQYQYYLLFRDQTTGKETYKNGRMLQIDPTTCSGQERVRLVIDFNYAYNPYSSYNDNWGCPITPRENVLAVRIDAGEKIYD